MNPGECLVLECQEMYKKVFWAEVFVTFTGCIHLNVQINQGPLLWKLTKILPVTTLFG